MRKGKDDFIYKLSFSRNVDENNSTVDIDENPYSLEPTNRGKGFQSISRDSRLMAC